jgi:LPXTG-motif cell wall-anchored protein
VATGHHSKHDFAILFLGLIAGGLLLLLVRHRRRKVAPPSAPA